MSWQYIKPLENAKKQCYFCENNKCWLLDGMETCKGCKFYKTKRQYLEDAEHAEELNKKKEGLNK